MLWSAVCLALSCCFLFHRWYTYRYSHWADLGVQGPRPRFPYGNLKSSLLMRSTIGEEFEKIYRDYPSKGIVGIYKLGQPMLLVRDPQVVGDVLVRQFGRFRDNDYYVNGANDPITSLNPFFVQGPRWKPLRSVIAAPVTLGKVRRMVPGDMVAPSRSMVKYLRQRLGTPLEIRSILGYYMMDTTAKCAYGLDWDSFFSDDVGFRSVGGDKPLGTGWWANLAVLASALNLKPLADTLKLSMTPNGVKDFLVGMVKEVSRSRIDKGTRRQDYIQQLIDSFIGDSYERCTERVYLDMASHCMTFFLDAYETSCLLAAYAVSELAANAEVQERLAREVVHTLGDRPLEELSHEMLHSMQLLEAVILETLRLHPPLQTITRVCTADTVLETSDDGGVLRVPVEEGTPVAVPISALHRDPEHFPQPLQFLPERFFESNKASVRKFTYLPFGEGPRKCTGVQFVNSQVKMCIATLVREFRVSVVEASSANNRLDPKSCFLHAPSNGIWVALSQRTPLHH